MKIVVNTRLLLRNRLEGIGWFSFETLKRITRQHPEHHFIFAFDRHYDEEFIFSDNITPVILSPQARHPVLFYIWLEFSLKGILNDIKPDMYLSPDGYLCLSTKVPALAVMHDLNFEHYPGDLPFSMRKYYRYFFPRFARKASRIATVSEYSKQDIVKTYGIDPAKIDVVYNGANSHFKAISNQEKQETKARYTRGCDFFLFVGSLHPRKNILRLLQAFDAFKKTFDSAMKLVIVGEKYWWRADIRQTYEQMHHKADVIFTGRLSIGELTRVTAAALAMTYVPYFEGFGIPILEAMYSETPVITSNLTSMPEVAGNAALFVDPFSVDSIKEAMLRLAKDEDLRKSLIEKGRTRRADFSWDKTAAALWASIEKTVVRPKRTVTIEQ